MPVQYYTVPAAVPSSKRDGWSAQTSPLGPFSLIRFGLAFDERVQPDRPKAGEAMGYFRREPGTITEFVERIVTRTETIDVRQVVQEEILTDTVITDVSSKLSQSLGLPNVMGTKGEIAASVRSILESQAMSRTSIMHAQGSMKEYEWKIKHKLPADLGEPQVSVKVYQRRHVDVYVVYLDWLEVTYSRTALGLRLKKVKNPAYREGNEARINEVELQMPLGRFSYWAPMAPSSFMINEADYVDEVGQVDEVGVSPIATPRLFERKRFPRVPSLYQLSNPAFPLKLKEATDLGLTEEELLGLEQQEPQSAVWRWRAARHLR